MTNLIPANEYCLSIFDGTHNTPKPVTEGKLLITSKHISGGSLDSSSAYFISEKDYLAIQKRSAVSQWDILFSMIGSVGEVYLERNANIPYAIKNIGVFSCASESKAKWLYYYLISPAAKTHIQRYLNGAVQKFLPLGALRNFPVPPYDESKEPLVKILLTIDAKIDCNNRINAELESIAKLLYDYWFVQFDFPDTKGKPYKSSGGAMVYNDVLKREIPENWSDGTLNDLGRIVGGSTPNTSKQKNFAISGIPWITPYDLSANQGNKFIARGRQDVSDDGIKDASLKILPAGSVLLSSRAPVGYMAIARNEVTTNQGFKSFIVNDGFSTEYIYYTICRSLKTIIQYSSGSTFKEISASVLKTVKIVLPNQTAITAFTNLVTPIFKRQNLLELETQQLTQLRDWLLPLLINGQVSTCNDVVPTKVKKR